MVRMRCREEQAPTGKHMGECIVSLRGWHPALAQAELSALFPQGEVKPLSSPRLAGLECSKDASELQISAGIEAVFMNGVNICLLYTSPSPRDLSTSRMPSSA